MSTDTQTRGSVRSSDNHNQNHVEENGEERKGEPVEDEEKDHGELKDESVEIEHQGVHGPSQHPGPAQLAAVLLAAALSFFIVALDITIVSTAIPAITAEFHSLDDVAWYDRVFKHRAEHKSTNSRNKVWQWLPGNHRSVPIGLGQSVQVLSNEARLHDLCRPV